MTTCLAPPGGKQETYLFGPQGQIFQRRVDQVDCLAAVGALSDNSEEDNGEGFGEELDREEGPAAWGARWLEVERGV